MKIKGFTLIELLAVIVILAIILLIAVPQVLDVIEDVKNNAYISTNDLIVEAAELYMASNIDELPNEIGNTSIVGLASELQAGGFIDEVSSMNNTCSGYVTVTKVEEDNYSYNPHINCSETVVTNPIDDGLVLHYTFDDFQEPTINLFNGNGSFRDSSGEHIGNPILDNNNKTYINGGWLCSTNYNDGICKIQSGGIYNNKHLVWYHNSVAGWKGTKSTSTISLEANKTYTFSVYSKINISDFGNPSGYAFYGPEGYRYHFIWEKEPTNNLNEWIKGSYSFTPPINMTGYVYLYGLTNAYSNLVIEYDGYQAEPKSYATPYTDDEREGIVKNYSRNSNNSTLDLETTPRWMEEKGNGYYLFDGVDDFIPLSTDLTTTIVGNPFTISAWVKTPSIAPGMSSSGIVSLGFGINFKISGSGDLVLKYDDGTGIPIIATSGINLYDDKFHYVSITYNGTEASLYIDGEVKQTSSINIGTRYTNGGAIGYEANNPSVYRFNGIIDNVKIYSRSLNEEEIYEDYILNKNKYN